MAVVPSATQNTVLDRGEDMFMVLQLVAMTVAPVTVSAGSKDADTVFSSGSFSGTCAMTAANPEDDVVPANPALLAAYYVRKLAGFFTVSVNEFNEIPLLTRGQLIEWTGIAAVALNPLLIHGLLVGAVGIYAFHKRDMALVIRRR